MKYTLHHIALSVDRLDWYLDFFTTVFEMTVQKTAGDAPERKIWFHEGVQLNEAPDTPAAGTLYDHLAISAEDKETVIARAEKFGCRRIKENWISLPDGVTIELI